MLNSLAGRFGCTRLQIESSHAHYQTEVYLLCPCEMSEKTNRSIYIERKNQYFAGTGNICLTVQLGEVDPQKRILLGS